MRALWFAIGAGSLLVACSSDGGPEPGPSTTTTVGSTSSGGGAGGSGGQDIGGGGAGGRINGCRAEDTMACTYTPAAEHGLGTIVERTFTYADAAGQTRDVNVELRRPAAPSTPLPIVLWSHGGSGGRSSAGNVGTEVGEVFVRAGYLFVAMAHPGRDRASYDALCTQQGWAGCGETCTMDSECTTRSEAVCDDGGCRYLKVLGWDRPNDVRAVIDGLEGLAAPGEPLEGLIDLTRILYAGHSSGAGGTMMVAGATRELNGPTLLLDPRPTAFMSFSPQGLGVDGFTSASYDGTGCTALASDPSQCLTRPHLLVSGVGDDTANEVAESRRQAFDLGPATRQRYLLWNLDEAARHTTFNFKPDSCPSYAQTNGLDPTLYPARCKLYLAGQTSAALAFADAYLRDHVPALDYLASDNLRALYGDPGSWTIK